MWNLNSHWFMIKKKEEYNNGRLKDSTSYLKQI